jgi:prepilin signal peptidase PulO-like enzyme (type II secretory pathway)
MLEPTGKSKVAIAIFVIAGPILAEVYWGRDIAFLKSLSPLMVAAVSAAGGAVAGFIMGDVMLTRLLGAVAGALAGFGGTYVFTWLYEHTNRIGAERIFVYIGGALPGLLMGIGVDKWHERSRKKSAAASPQR